jgi:formylglycine-generating enzyme required for sulfatase activity
MTEVFLSYARRDFQLSKKLVRALTDLGIGVWWDQNLQEGSPFTATIIEKIASADLVVVLWTRNSVVSNFVLAEAKMAADLKRELYPLRSEDLDPATIPPPFNVLQTSVLRNINNVAEGILRRLQLAETTLIEFQRRRREHRRRLLMILGGGLGLVAAAVLLVADIPAARQTLHEWLALARTKIASCDGRYIRIGETNRIDYICVDTEAFRAHMFHDCPGCPEMVVIPAGAFVIGSPKSEPGRDNDEEPQTPIRIAAFAIGRYELTRDEWEPCVRDGACRVKPAPTQALGGRHPMGDLSWNDAQDFVAWMRRTTAKAYRLPSEAEWEYVTRAGTDSPRYWGYNPNQACKFANVADLQLLEEIPNGQNPEGSPTERPTVQQIHQCNDGFARLAPVGALQPNAFMLHDTIGNVWEWVNDCAYPNYSLIPTDGKSYEEPECKTSVLRGGSYLSGPASARSANRFQGGRARTSSQPDFGLRIARDLK